jgi:predicted DNA-binding transcriptional regulator AlpA
LWFTRDVRQALGLPTREIRRSTIVSTSIQAPISIPPVTPARRLIDAKEVGRILGCSWRHVLRLADQGVLPWGVKLGALRRWDVSEIEAFLASGCRPIRQAMKP